MKRESARYLGSDVHLEVRSSFDVEPYGRIGLTLTYDGAMPRSGEFIKVLQLMLYRSALTLRPQEPPK